MKHLLFLTMILAQFHSSGAAAQSLQTIKDANLRDILTNFQIVEQMADSSTSSYSVNLIEVREQGECQGSSASCPRSHLFISVSSYGELPDQNLYVIPDVYFTSFDGWLSLPKVDGPDHFVSFAFTLREPADNAQDGVR